MIMVTELVSLPSTTLLDDSRWRQIFTTRNIAPGLGRCMISDLHNGTGSSGQFGSKDLWYWRISHMGDVLGYIVQSR